MPATGHNLFEILLEMKKIVHTLFSTAAIVASLAIAAVAVDAQQVGQVKTEKQAGLEKRSATNPKLNSPPAAPAPVYSAYKGIKIGMAANDVRQTLGHPQDKSDALDVFAFSNSEEAQVYYDKSHQVTAISIDYRGAKNLPSAEQVLGHGIQAKNDGSMYALERYPDAGYWVSYNRTAGNDPLVTITLQKF
jgi:hypothetical protein